MATYSSELETVLKRYINSLGRLGKDRLRELLKNTSVDTRYELLMKVRGSGIISTLTGLHRGVFVNDLETIKYMFNDFLANQKYDVMQIRCNEDTEG